MDRSNESPNAAPLSGGAVSAPDLRTNVLLIEADAQQTELFSELIREVADCQVDVIARVESGFDWVGRLNYQLVVIDATEGVDGIALLERLRRMSPETAVILVSGRATVEEAVAAIRMGAEDYFTKPVHPENFRLAVKRALDRKVVLGSSSGAASYLNLLNTCQLISATLEQERIFQYLAAFFERELKCSHMAVYTLESAEVRRIDLGAVSPSSGPDGRPTSSGPDRAMIEVLDIALAGVNPLPKMAEANEHFRFLQKGPLTPSVFLFHFRCVGEKDYFCAFLSPELPSDLDTFAGHVRMLRAQLEVTGKNIEQYQGVQQLVYVDDATGLYNTRYLNYILEREISQYESTAKSFAILFLDADHFKRVNDSYGHLVGTKLLNELGAQLRTYVRASDTVFRYGGDEFVAVLSPCDLKTAEIVAERIRSSVEKHPFLASENLNAHFTVSIGVALFPDHASTKRAIIDAADHAMYVSKNRTRNAVTIAVAQEGQPETDAKSGLRHATSVAHPARSALEGILVGAPRNHGVKTGLRRAIRKKKPAKAKKRAGGRR